MTDKRKQWPNIAEAHRLDAIALLMDVQFLALSTQAALSAKNYNEAMRLQAKLYDVGKKGQQLLREAASK